MHKDAIINKTAHIRFWHTPERCKEKENLVLIKKQLDSNPSFNTFFMEIRVSPILSCINLTPEWIATNNNIYLIDNTIVAG